LNLPSYFIRQVHHKSKIIYLCTPKECEILYCQLENAHSHLVFRSFSEGRPHPHPHPHPHPLRDVAQLPKIREPLVRRIYEDPRKTTKSEICCFFFRDRLARHNNEELMLFFTYILESEVDGSFYIGQTNLVEDRLNRHNKGYSKSTSHKRPWKLL